MIGVVVADSMWSCNDGGESHGGLDMLIDGDGLFQITRLQMLWTMVEQVERHGTRAFLLGQVVSWATQQRRPGHVEA